MKTSIYFAMSIQKAVIIALILGLCLGVISCNQSYNRPNLSVLPLQETYQQAKNVALKWRSDAQLQSADFDIEFSASPESINCNYTFLSATSHRFLLVFVKADGSGYHLETAGDAWPADRPIGKPIVIEEINLESKEALQQILEKGGDTFFERYQIRNKGGGLLPELFRLQLNRLDEYKGEGELIWTSGFSIDSPHAQLYMGIEDDTGDLLKVKAYGEQEQEFWLREITVTDKISIGKSKNFFDIFDIQLDKITEENSRKYADFTIISPKTTWLIYGQVAHSHVKTGAIFHFGEYDITVTKVDKDWFEVQIMPIVRWYKSNPEGD
jgi:hypothetical protein